MGRKALGDAGKNAVLRIRMSADELQSLESAAIATGQPTSTWARDLLLAAAGQAIEPAPAKGKKAAKRSKGQSSLD